MQQQEHAAPTVKQHLAALRHLFDWLVRGRHTICPKSYSKPKVAKVSELQNQLVAP
jgi:hypothetical protein